MPLISILVAATLSSQSAAQSEDPLALPIGTPGTVLAQPNRYVRTRDGAQGSARDVAVSARGYSFVFVGESHTTASHHQAQAEIIRALVEDGRKVCVGFEMFTRPSQENLAPWSRGWWSEEEFVERSGWKADWNMPFALYRPIFEVIREHHLPMAALNVPREWVRAVSRGGVNALKPEWKQELPELDLGNASHRRVFDALVSGHPMSAEQGHNMYAGQVLWDEAMADSAIRFLGRFASQDWVMVIVAGSGHGLYGQGINYRITKRTGKPVLTVICVDGDAPREVSRGIGDWVFMGS
jgi:uncharacterized iron-regulated protein